MSYGTSIRLPEGRVYLNRMALNSLHELKEKRDEAVKDVRDYEIRCKLFHKIEMALHNFILQFVEVKKVILMPDKELA